VWETTVQNIDALSRNGEIYNIKAVTSRNGTTGSFWDPESILTWNDFMENKSFNKRMNNYNVSLTKNLFNLSRLFMKSAE